MNDTLFREFGVREWKRMMTYLSTDGKYYNQLVWILNIDINILGISNNSNGLVWFRIANSPNLLAFAEISHSSAYS